MSARRVPAIVLMMAASGAWAFGCQLLYDKNDLTVGTGGSGAGATTSTTSAGGSGASTTSAGGTTGGGGASTTSTGGTSTTGGGGAGGTIAAGGTTTTGGGGTGGMTTTTTGSGGDLDGGLDGDASDGGDCSGERLFVVGTSPTGVLCATFAPGAGWAAATDASGGSNERPAAVMVDGQKGVGVFFQQGAAPAPLRAVELSGGACSAAADVGMATTKAAPSLALLGGKGRALFQGAVGAGTDHPFVAAWDPVSKWGAAAQVDVNVFSQAPAGLGTSGAEMLAVYGGGDDNLYRVRFAAGAWVLPAVSFKDMGGVSEQSNKALTPAVAGLDGGKWLVVFQEKANPTQLRWLTGDGTINAASKMIATALSAQAVALASVPGGAVLAFRGTDQGVYASVFDAGNGGSWGAIERIGGAATTTAVTPAVAAGVCGHQAELVFVDAADGAVKHASLTAGMWSAPVAVGGSASKGVALARSP